MSIDDGYVDVATRIGQFREKHPEGSLYPFDAEKPFEIVTIDGHTFVVVVAAAYRTPDDMYPGVGMAWEPFPGQSPYTEDSELQNAQTGAWGRAIVAALAADTTKSIASSEDVRNRVAADKKDKPASVAEKPKVKRAPPKVARQVTDDEAIAAGATKEELATTPVGEEPAAPAAVSPAVELAESGIGMPLVVEVPDTAEDLAAEALAAELTNGAEPERAKCADCGGDIESDDQVDLSLLRFRRPLDRVCFAAAKKPAVAGVK